MNLKPIDIVVSIYGEISTVSGYTIAACRELAIHRKPARRRSRDRVRYKKHQLLLWSAV